MLICFLLVLPLCAGKITEFEIFESPASQAIYLLFRQVSTAIDLVEPVSNVASREEYVPRAIPVIYPRYFLSLPEGALEKDIEAAYNVLMARLTHEKEVAEGFMRYYWGVVMEHLQIAYNALMHKEGAEEQFNHMINTDQALRWYSKQYTNPRMLQWQ